MSPAERTGVSWSKRRSTSMARSAVELRLEAATPVLPAMCPIIWVSPAPPVRRESRYSGHLTRFSGLRYGRRDLQGGAMEFGVQFFPAVGPSTTPADRY